MIAATHAPAGPVHIHQHGLTVTAKVPVYSWAARGREWRETTHRGLTMDRAGVLHLETGKDDPRYFDLLPTRQVENGWRKLICAHPQVCSTDCDNGFHAAYVRDEDYRQLAGERTSNP